jgi:hypothetical protein
MLLPNILHFLRKMYSSHRRCILLSLCYLSRGSGGYISPMPNTTAMRTSGKLDIPNRIRKKSVRVTPQASEYHQAKTPSYHAFANRKLSPSLIKDVENNRSS